MNDHGHLPRQHPHADAFLGAQQANAGSSVWRDDREIAQWLFKACMCGEDTPVVRRRSPGSDAWEGVRVCKSCGRKWEIQLGGEFEACGATMTEPYGLWPHRQRYRWAVLRWLGAEKGRKIRLNVDAQRHQQAMTPALAELSLPAWPLYFCLRSMEWAREPRRNARRLRRHARQFLSPFRILTILYKEILNKGRVWSDRHWSVFVRDETHGKIRTVRVHLFSGQWGLQIEDPAETEKSAPWPPIFYVAGDDMLELVGRLVGLRNRHEARDWLRRRGYTPPERIGLQRMTENTPPRASNS